MRFDGRVALITGAASGIGNAVARRLASEGAAVYALDIDEAGLAELVASAAGSPGGIEGAVVDVTRPRACREAVTACVERFGGLDVLGNVAGVLRHGRFTTLTEADYRQVMAVNVDGPVFLSQAAIPHLLERAGCIVNLASIGGIMGSAYYAAYSVSKGAVVQLTRCLAVEYLKTPLRVNAIAPGPVDTPMLAGLQRDPEADEELGVARRAVRGQASPEDIATLFAFLASEDAGRIHGAIVPIDAGASAG